MAKADVSRLLLDLFDFYRQLKYDYEVDTITHRHQKNDIPGLLQSVETLLKINKEF